MNSKILEINALAAAKPKCIRFDKGSANFPPPPEFHQAALSVLENDKSAHYGYLPETGLLTLREKISVLEESTGNGPVDPSQIVITHGALSGVATTLSVLCSAGDEVIVNNICFEGFINLAENLSLKLVYCDLADTNSIKSVVSNRTRAILFSSPENPTGKIYSPEEMDTIADVAKQNNLVIISDEVSNQLIYPGVTRTSMRVAALENTIVVNSMSKNYFLPGLRIGWMILPQKYVEKCAAKIGSQSVCVNRFGQMAADNFLGLLPKMQIPKEYIETLEQRRRVIIKGLESLAKPIPQGGTNCFMDVGVLSEKFSKYLLEKYNVAVIPGILFGQSGATSIRVGFGSVDLADIDKGCAAVREALTQTLDK